MSKPGRGQMEVFYRVLIDLPNGFQRVPVLLRARFEKCCFTVSMKEIIIVSSKPADTFDLIKEGTSMCTLQISQDPPPNS